MNFEFFFTLFNGVAVLGWIVLIFSPKWKWARTIALSGAFSILLAGIYVFLLLYCHGKSEGGFGSLAGVRSLFEHDGTLLLGWVHYLAFDLMVGTWIVLDSQKRSIKHLWIIPCLLLTLWLGPSGLLAYFVLRSVLKKGVEPLFETAKSSGIRNTSSRHFKNQVLKFSS